LKNVGVKLKRYPHCETFQFWDRRTRKKEKAIKSGATDFHIWRKNRPFRGHEKTPETEDYHEMKAGQNTASNILVGINGKLLELRESTAFTINFPKKKKLIIHGKGVLHELCLEKE